MKKKIVINIVCIILLVILIFLGYIKINSYKYSRNYEYDIKLPGLHRGFIPQGIDIVKDKYYISGYRMFNKASRVYIIENNKQTTLILQEKDGSKFTHHAGGIAVNNNLLYVAADDKGIYVYDLSKIKKNKTNKIKPIDTYKIDKFNVAYLTINNNHLIVGEFYRKGNYETDKTHRLITPSKDKNTSIALAINLIDTKSGLGEIVYAYSTTSQIQGMAITKNNIYLSSSYALSNSKIYNYSIDKIVEDKIKINNNEIPLYYLDSNSLENTTTITPMSEEIIVKDNYLYIVNESASNKYLFGKITNGKYLYKIKLNNIN